MRRRAAVVDTIEVGNNPGTPVEASGFIWVPNAFGDSVSVIDAATRTVVDTINVGKDPVTPVAANGLIWVSNYDGDSVSIIDETLETNS